MIDNILYFYNTSGSETATCLLNAIAPTEVDRNKNVKNTNPNNLREIIQNQLKETIGKYNSSIPSEKQKAMQMIKLLINDIFDQDTLNKYKNEEDNIDSKKIKNLKNDQNANDKDKFLSENADNLLGIYNCLNGEHETDPTTEQLTTFVSLFDNKNIFTKEILSISNNQSISQNLIPILCNYFEKDIVLVTPKTTNSTSSFNIKSHDYNIHINNANQQFDINNCIFIHHDGITGDHYSHLSVERNEYFINAYNNNKNITDFDLREFKKLYQVKQLNEALNDKIIKNQTDKVFTFTSTEGNSNNTNDHQQKIGNLFVYTPNNDSTVKKNNDVVTLEKGNTKLTLIHHNNEYLILKKNNAQDCYEVLRPVSDKYKEFVFINNTNQVQGRVKITYQPWNVEKIGTEAGVTVNQNTKAITYNRSEVQLSSLFTPAPHGINLKNETKGRITGNNDGEMLVIIDNKPIILQYSDTHITGSNHPQYQVTLDDGTQKTIYINKWKLANPTLAGTTSKIGKSISATEDDWHDVNNTGDGNGFILSFNSNTLQLKNRQQKTEQPQPAPATPGGGTPPQVPLQFKTAFRNAGLYNADNIITLATNSETKNIIPFGNQGRHYIIENHTITQIGTSIKYVVTQASDTNAKYVFDGTDQDNPKCYKVTQDLATVGGGYIVRTSVQNTTPTTYAMVATDGTQTALTGAYPIEIQNISTNPIRKGYLIMENQPGKAVILTQAASNTWNADITTLGDSASQSGNIISIKDPTTNAFTYFDLDTTNGTLNPNIQLLIDINNTALNANNGYDTVLPAEVNISPTISQTHSANAREITIDNKKAYFNAGDNVNLTHDTNPITYTKTVNGVRYTVSINTTANTCIKTITWGVAQNNCVLTQTINIGTPNTSTEALTINGQEATYTAANTTTNTPAYWTADGVNYTIANDVITAKPPVVQGGQQEQPVEQGGRQESVATLNLALISYQKKLLELKNDIKTLKTGEIINTKTGYGYKTEGDDVKLVTTKTEKDGNLAIQTHEPIILPHSAINIDNIPDTVDAFLHPYHDNGKLKSEMVSNVKNNNGTLEIIDQNKFIASCLKYLNHDPIWINMMIADTNMTPLDYLLEYVFKENANYINNETKNSPFYQYLNNLPQEDKYAFNNIAIYQLRGGKNDEYLKKHPSNTDLPSVLQKCNTLSNTYLDNNTINKPSNLEVMSILADLGWITSPIQGNIPDTLDPLTFIAQDNFRMLYVWKNNLSKELYDGVCYLIHRNLIHRLKNGEKIDFELASKFIKQIPFDITKLPFVFDGHEPKNSNVMISNIDSKPANIPYTKMEGYFNAVCKNAGKYTDNDKSSYLQSLYGSDFNWKNPNDVANLYARGIRYMQSSPKDANDAKGINAEKFASWCQKNSKLQGFVFEKSDDLNTIKKRINTYYNNMNGGNVQNSALPFPVNNNGEFTTSSKHDCQITFGTGTNALTKTINLADYFDISGNSANRFKINENGNYTADFNALQKAVTDAVIGVAVNSLARGGEPAESSLDGRSRRGSNASSKPEVDDVENPKRRLSL